jgi:hypothetical protein
MARSERLGTIPTDSGVARRAACTRRTFAPPKRSSRQSPPRLSEVADTAASVGESRISAELREAAETIRRLKALESFRATILAEADAVGHA